jgi:hypothetical protein
VVIPTIKAAIKIIEDLAMAILFSFINNFQIRVPLRGSKKAKTLNHKIFRSFIALRLAAMY